MANLIGQQIGNYEIVAKIGSGGMATVYRARQLNIKRDVAIKVIKSDLAESPDFIRRFEREAETIASLDQPHILKIFDYGQHDDLIYLVMELKTGGTLDQMIRQNPLSLEQTTRLLDQIAGALDHAHEKGIIHRDLKPQNVLLDNKGNGFLTDFGIAKLLQNSSTVLTQAGMAIGTPAYMSPEQWLGQPIDSRTDIYALGIMLYEMLSGHLPFTADTPYGLMQQHVNQAPPPITALRPDVSAAVERVLEKAIAKNRDDRFPSASDLANAFRAAQSGGDPVPVAAATKPATPLSNLSSSAASEGQPTIIPPATPSAAPRNLPIIPIIGAIIVIAVLAGVEILPGLLNHSAATPTALALAASATSAAVSPSRTNTTIPTAKPTALNTATAKPVIVESSATRTPTKTLTSTVTATNAATSTATASPTTTLQSTSTPSITLSPGSATDIAPVTKNSQWAKVEQPFGGVSMVLVPPGCFVMGSNSGGNNDEGSPFKQCFDQPFWIDKYLVTNDQFAQFNGKTAQPSNWPGAKRPRENITWFEARVFCALRGGRLPTEAEWEYAARGPDSLIYPWGNDFVDTNAIYNVNSNGQTADVGADQRVKGASWVGALDMSGNVWEWTSTVYLPYPYSQDDKHESNSDATSSRVLRGGSWNYTPKDLRSADRGSNNPSYQNSDVGLRCAHDFSP